MNFIQTVIDDLKNKPWPVGTTTAQKNQYRWKIVALMGVLAGALLFVFPIAAIVPAAVAAVKIRVILTDH